MVGKKISTQIFFLKIKYKSTIDINLTYVAKCSRNSTRAYNPYKYSSFRWGQKEDYAS